MASFKKSLIYLHIFVFLAGLTGPLGHLISLSGLHLVLYRMGLTSLVVLIIKFFSKTPSITWKQRMQLIGIGVLISIHWACFFASIKLSNVSIALVCFSSTGLFTVLLEPLFTKHSFSLIDFLIGGLSLVGILLIFHFDIKFRDGIIVGLFSAFIAALFTVFNKKITANIKVPTIQSYQMTSGFIFLLIVSVVLQSFYNTPIPIPTNSDLVWIVILALGCTVLANFLMLVSLRQISAFTLNITLNLEPVYGILIAFIFFGEHKEVGISFYAGILLITGSVLLQMWRIFHPTLSAKTAK